MAVERVLAAGPAGEPLGQQVILERAWREPPDSVVLDAEYQLADGGDRVRIRLGRHEVWLDEPVLLEPVHVPKPWGQEIWLTGVEARGESAIRTNAGTLPLSQYLALAPRRLARRAPLVLLKILDPRSEPVLGDLYFEAHREKQEVYVVTHVDPAAWPDGRGRVRFGMDQALRQRYGDDDRFRRDYLTAVQAYEQVRRAIDDGDAVPEADEHARRAAMESFTHLRELTVGDVVVVPTWLPHSLQHGVRVIEFQTPTYERYIISFAQRVLTQSHWDSETAVARMRLDAPPPPTFETLQDGVELIFDFDEFRVWRVTLPAGGSLVLPAHPSYALCIGVRGTVSLGPLTLSPEQAAFVPAEALAEPHRHHRARLGNATGDEAVVLVAAPDL